MIKLSIFTILFLVGLFNNKAQAQLNNDTCNCPPLYTRSDIFDTDIKIGKVVVLDSAKYSTLPSILGNLDSLSNLIHYPEIAKMANVFGEVKYLIKITGEGEVKELKLIKGAGAGLDESAMDILKEIKFNPAKIDKKVADSQVYIVVNFKVNKSIDKPDFELDEIKYEGFLDSGYLKRIIIFRKDGSAYFYRRNGDEEESIGQIKKYRFSKLSDFIISQCFFNLNDVYKGRTSDRGISVLTIKYNNDTKSVTSRGGEFYPISFWAIIKLIQYFKSVIKWEIIKYDSGIEKLPKRNEKEE